MADEPEDEVPPGDPGRRKFLKIATCAVGGGIGAVVAVPAVRYLLHPVGERVVSAGTDPIDVGHVRQLSVGGPPVRVRVVAPTLRDGWASASDVPLGSAWLRRTEEKRIAALSAVCPHLGCSIGFDGKLFRCPCHESAFDPTGKRLDGPAERDLDTLDAAIGDDGRIRLVWKNFRVGGSDKVEV